MRILICGDREWGNSSTHLVTWNAEYQMIQQFVSSLPDDSIVIHGTARGADSLAGAAAKSRGLKVIPYPPNWTRYGKAAGYVRNQEMLEQGKPDAVVYFHGALNESKGTKDMVLRANRAKVHVFANLTHWTKNESAILQR